jgi:hypothetical protein
VPGGAGWTPGADDTIDRLLDVLDVPVFAPERLDVDGEQQIA